MAFLATVSQIAGDSTKKTGSVVWPKNAFFSANSGTLRVNKWKSIIEAETDTTLLIFTWFLTLEVLYFGWPNQPSSGTMTENVHCILCGAIFLRFSAREKKERLPHRANSLQKKFSKFTFLRLIATNRSLLQSNTKINNFPWLIQTKPHFHFLQLFMYSNSPFMVPLVCPFMVPCFFTLGSVYHGLPHPTSPHPGPYP